MLGVATPLPGPADVVDTPPGAVVSTPRAAPPDGHATGRTSPVSTLSLRLRAREIGALK